MRIWNKIIFLDEDNTKLSPVTEQLFRKKLASLKTEVPEVYSRGNVVLFPEPVNQKIVQVAKAYELDLSDYSAVQLSAEDLSQDTLILAMDASSKAMVYEHYANATNIYTLKEYLGSAGDLKLPLGGTLEEYATIIEIISGLLDVLLERVLSEDEKERAAI